MLKTSILNQIPYLSRHTKPLISQLTKVPPHRNFPSILSRQMNTASSNAIAGENNTSTTEPKKIPRLTELSLGGGCGCKISPGKLQEILRQVPLDSFAPDENLLVGAGGSDDAAVYLLNPQQAVVVTTDFFMPIVDDAADFGRVAAANAISDVYAMGGRPILALSVLGMPINVLPTETIQKILNGGVDICRAAKVPLAGGHSIDSREPIFGLVVTGVVHPNHLRRNNQPQIGDFLVLTKPLGAGVLTTAARKGQLDEKGYNQVMCSMLQLNCLGAELVENESLAPAIHAMTDVTGFGLLGHLLEMVQAPGTAKGQDASDDDASTGAASSSKSKTAPRMRAVLKASQVPLMSSAAELAQSRVLPGAVSRNWSSYGNRVVVKEGVEKWQQDLFCDPQTSGGLLIAVAPEHVDAVLKAASESHQQQTDRRRATKDLFAGALALEARVIGTIVEAVEGEDAGIVEIVS